MPKPLVSVIMPTKDRSKFILSAVASLIGQTYRNWELIILDEGSDDTESKIRLVSGFDNRIRYVKTKNVGRAKARNILLRLSNGELVCHLDDDDFLEKDAIEKMVEAFDPEIALAYSDSFLVNENGDVTDHKISPDFSRDNLVNLGFNHFGMYRKSVALHVGGFNESVWCEDGDLFMRIAKNFECKRVPHLLYYYRSHDTNSGHSRPKCGECEKQSGCNYYKIWTEEYENFMKNKKSINQALP